MFVSINNLRIETAGTEEEVAEGLAEALGVEFEEEEGIEVSFRTLRPSP